MQTCITINHVVTHKLRSKLPIKAELRKVIIDCGGTIDDYNNKNNTYYQNFYKQKYFSDKDAYWTRKEKYSSYAWLVGLSTT